MKRNADSPSLGVEAVVFGGGPAGLATGLRLRERGRTVAILERSAYPPGRIGEHLTADGEEALRRLDVWDPVQDGGHLESPGILSIWGSDQPIEVPAIFRPTGAGLHLDRPAFDKTLVRELESRGGYVVREVRSMEVRPQSAGWSVEFASPDGRRTIETPFLVDATGRTAWLANNLGPAPVRLDALIGVVVLSDSHRPELPLVEAVEGGWWYSASLPDKRQVTIYFTDADLRGPGTLAAVWRSALDGARATRERVGARADSAQPRGLPAQSQCLATPVGHRWIAVGDAAISMDPLTSGGIAAGLRGGIQAADAVHAFLAGDEAPARAYARDLGTTFRAYCVARRRYYSLERRWPAAPFWARRGTDLAGNGERPGGVGPIEPIASDVSPAETAFTLRGPEARMPWHRPLTCRRRWRACPKAG